MEMKAMDYLRMPGNDSNYWWILMKSKKCKGILKNVKECSVKLSNTKKSFGILSNVEEF